MTTALALTATLAATLTLAATAEAANIGTEIARPTISAGLRSCDTLFRRAILAEAGLTQWPAFSKYSALHFWERSIAAKQRRYGHTPAVRAEWLRFLAAAKTAAQAQAEAAAESETLSSNQN